MTAGITNLSDSFSGTAQTKSASEQVSPQGSVGNSNTTTAAAENSSQINSHLQVDLKDPREVQQVLEKLNLAVEQIRTGLNFRIEKETPGDVVIKVVDQNTDETIRQIPSEEMLRIYQRLQEVNSLLFDDIEV